MGAHGGLDEHAGHDGHRMLEMLGNGILQELNPKDIVANMYRML